MMIFFTPIRRSPVDESLTDPYGLLETTPYGRQEDFEDSPQGWPQKKTYG